VLRKNPVKGDTKAKSATQLNTAMRQGNVEAVAKVHHTAPANARKLEEEDADFRQATLSVEFKVALMKARQAKGWTQAEVAQKMNAKASVVTDYESGKVVPNPQVIQQLQRVLGCQLPKIVKPKKIAGDE
jgi:putative transcription factor